MHACVSYYTLSLLRKTRREKFHAGQEESFFNWRWEGKRELFFFTLAFSRIAEKSLRGEQRKYVAFTQCHSGAETKGRRAMSGISVLQKTRIYGKRILWMLSGRKLFGSVCLLAGFNQVAHSDFCQ